MFLLSGWPKIQNGLTIFSTSYMLPHVRLLKKIMPKFRSLQRVRDLLVSFSVGIGVIIPKNSRTKITVSMSSR